MMVMLLTVAGLTASAWAADSMEALQQRFAARFGALKAAKKAGKLGEVVTGFVEAVSGEAAATSLAAEENGDRTKLYALIAEREKTSPALVAERNAIRNFTNASPGEYLKGKDGKWQKKK
jgi:uncharacterized protein YdbL (DUF1318 family)